MNEEYKCKDCKWLTGKKTIRGIECMNPKLQEKWNRAKNLWMGELRKDTARYKQRNAPACKKFEAKESKPMSRYIDADALEYDTEWSEYHDGFTAYSQMAIDTAPSIDIVRCKECRWWNYEMSGCKRNPSVVAWRDDDFCSYGEREGE